MKAVTNFLFIKNCSGFIIHTGIQQMLSQTIYQCDQLGQILQHAKNKIVAFYHRESNQVDNMVSTLIKKKVLKHICGHKMPFSEVIGIWL